MILGWSRSQRMYEVTDNLGDDWLHQEAFAEWNGWSAEYTDPQASPRNNQTFHFWFYVAVAYFDGPGIATLGNIYHEMPIRRDDYIGTIPIGELLFDINPRLINGGTGTSKQDYDLGMRGMELGSALRSHGSLISSIPMPPIKPSEIGDWLRTNLGEKKK